MLNSVFAATFIETLQNGCRGGASIAVLTRSFDESGRDDTTHFRPIQNHILN